jgi:hypothetical protein
VNLPDRSRRSAGWQAHHRRAGSATLDGFHREALAAGGNDDGAPGVRERYHDPTYYGAFVLDPDDYNFRGQAPGRMSKRSRVAVVLRPGS